MRTGRLNISRGSPSERRADHIPPQLALVPQAAEPAHQDINDRLTALERLTRLYELGALTADEFIDEKALILGRAARAAGPVHFVPATPRQPRRGPSLIGRMLSWQFLLFSLLVGLGFSFAVQPETTGRFFSQLFRALAG